MNEKCKLSIIVVSYNTKETTDNCLSSIYNSMWKDPFEVIVIDNDSHDGSVEMIKSKYPYVKLIVNEDNKLFAIANNQGANWACGKYLLLLNSDTLVEKDNLQKMLSYFETVPDDVICIGPKVLNMDGTIQSSGYPNPGLRGAFLYVFQITQTFASFYC